MRGVDCGRGIDPSGFQLFHGGGGVDDLRPTAVRFGDPAVPIADAVDDLRHGFDGCGITKDAHKAINCFGGIPRYGFPISFRQRFPVAHGGAVCGDHVRSFTLVHSHYVTSRPRGADLAARPPGRFAGFFFT